MERLADALEKRVLVLDGAMGTMIQRAGLNEGDFRGELFVTHGVQLKGCNDVLCLTRPDVIGGIHRAYLEAGADVIETCSFNSQRFSLKDYGLEDCVTELNREAARIARAEADRMTGLTPDRPRWVAGSVGPTSKSCSLSPSVDDPAYRDVTFDALAEAYREQMRALIEGGVDVLLIETVFDTLNAKAAAWASEEAMRDAGRRVDVMVSMTVSNRTGRSLSGQSLPAFVASMEHAGLLCMGLNCSFGAKDMLPCIRELSELTDCYTVAYPNAGLPNELGAYNESAEAMVEHVRPFLEEGLVNMIGGCCGTTPAHIKRISELARLYRPRERHEKKRTLRLSGLDLLELD